MKFTIDRATWRQGNSEFDIAGCTELLNERGFRCCLGFLGKACGYNNDQLLDRSFPSSVVNHSEKDLWPTGIIASQRALADVNDLTSYTNKEREVELTRLFKELNIEVEFVGHYPAVEDD